jgi:pimeloyl-ACP methyl ester carboxylesterase
MTMIKTSDGTEIYYKDWGEGPVVTFSHGWPLNYPGAPHGLTATHQDQLNRDLLAFIKA